MDGSPSVWTVAHMLTLVFNPCTTELGGDGCHLLVDPPGKLHRRPRTPRHTYCIDLWNFLYFLCIFVTFFLIVLTFFVCIDAFVYCFFA